jgi:RNA polymerase sigma factor (sigma-70 family)
VVKLVRLAPDPPHARRAGGAGGVDGDPLAELARAAARGDRRARRELVLEVAPAMLRAVRRILGHAPVEPEDVMQEALEGVLEALPSFRGECSLLHFAYRIAALTALAARRQARARAQWVADAPGALDGPAVDAPSPADLALVRRRREILGSLIDELPPPQAEVLVLHCGLGFTVAELAAALGRPVETIRSRLRLAKQSLRDRIGASRALAEILEVRR